MGGIYVEKRKGNTGSQAHQKEERKIIQNVSTSGKDSYGELEDDEAAEEEDSKGDPRKARRMAISRANR